MSSGSFICEERRKPKWRLVNDTARKATAQCIDVVHQSKTEPAAFKEHIRSGKLPELVLRRNAARGNSSTEIPTAALDDESPVFVAAVLHACEHGLQNNVGVEYYSEFMNAVARAHDIPVADMWNLTIREWQRLEHKWLCAATVDGIHYHEPTMWKQVRLWFDLFRKER